MAASSDGNNNDDNKNDDNMITDDDTKDGKKPTGKNRMEIRVEFPPNFSNSNNKPISAREESQRLYQLIFQEYKDKVKFIGKDGGTLTEKSHFPDTKQGLEQYFTWIDRAIRHGTKTLAFFTVEIDTPFHEFRNALWRTYIAPHNIWMHQHFLSSHSITDIGFFDGYSQKHCQPEDAQEEFADFLHKCKCKKEGKDPLQTDMDNRFQMEFGKRPIKEKYKDGHGKEFEGEGKVIIGRVNTEDAAEIKALLLDPSNPVPFRFGQFIVFNSLPKETVMQIIQQHNAATDDLTHTPVYNIPTALMLALSNINGHDMTVREALLLYEMNGEKVLSGVEITPWTKKGTVNFVYHPNKEAQAFQFIDQLEQKIRAICPEYAMIQTFPTGPWRYKGAKSYGKDQGSSMSIPSHIRIRETKLDPNRLKPRPTEKRGPIGHYIDVEKASTLKSPWYTDDNSTSTHKTRNKTASGRNPTPGEAFNRTEDRSEGRSEGSKGSNDESYQSRMSSIESKMSVIDEFIIQMKESQKKQDTNNKALQEIIAHGVDQRVKEQESQAKALQQQNAEATHRAQQWQAYMETAAEERKKDSERQQVVLEMNMQREKRYEEQMRVLTSTLQSQMEIQRQTQEDAKTTRAEMRLMFQNLAKRPYDTEESELDEEGSKRVDKKQTPPRTNTMDISEEEFTELTQFKETQTTNRPQTRSRRVSMTQNQTTGKSGSRATPPETVHRTSTSGDSSAKK